MIIGITGLARSGKDTVAKYLVEEYGFKHYDFYRDVFLEEMKKRKMEPTKDNASKLGDELRNEHGMGVMAKLLFEKVNAEDIVITGIRSPQEVDYFRGKSSQFVLIMLEAPLEQRYSRRNESDPQSLEDFKQRDERDLANKGMESVFLMADYTLENDKEIEDLYDEVDNIMEEIQQHRKSVNELKDREVGEE